MVLMESGFSSSGFSSMDEVFEILSRTCLKGLSVCRAVSREWNEMTYKSYFLRSFCETTNSKIGLIVPVSNHWYYTTLPTGYYQIINLFQKTHGGTSPSNTPLLDFEFIYPRRLSWTAADRVHVQSGMNIEAVAVPGFVLCSRHVYVKGRSGLQYFICKPSTRQWHRIPNPRTKFFTQVTAMTVFSHSDPVFFKIIRFSEPKINQRVVRVKSELYLKTICEIFDSRTWSWKRLKDLMLPFGVFLTMGDPAVQACGVLHWITSDYRVFAFDINTEEWTLFGLPDSLPFKDLRSKRLVNFKGTLALLIRRDWESCLLELWVLKDYVKNKVWTKEKTVNYGAVKKVDRLVSPVAMHSSDAVVWTNHWKFIVHNFEHDSTEVVKVDSMLGGVRDMFVFQTDMESWGLPQVMRKPFPERPAASRRRMSSSCSTLVAINNCWISWSSTLAILSLIIFFCNFLVCVC